MAIDDQKNNNPNEEDLVNVSQIEHVDLNLNLNLPAESKKRVVVTTTRDSRFGEYIATHRTNPLSKSLLQLYPILFVAFMNSAANGFDGNTFGGVSALPDFESRFGTNVAASQGFLAAIYILGIE